LEGDWKSGKVKLNGFPLNPRKSLKVYNHSPTGFSWSYGGSGPAQLALAVLLECFPEEVATQYYQRFKWDVIAKLPARDFSLVFNVEAWLNKNDGRVK